MGFICLADDHVGLLMSRLNDIIVSTTVYFEILHQCIPNIAQTSLKSKPVPNPSTQPTAHTFERKSL
jgi:hypothetical protein